MAPPSPPPKLPTGFWREMITPGTIRTADWKVLGVEIADLVLRYAGDLAPQAVDLVALRNGRGRHDDLVHPDGLPPVAVRRGRRRRPESEHEHQEKCETDAIHHEGSPARADGTASGAKPDDYSVSPAGKKATFGGDCQSLCVPAGSAVVFCFPQPHILVLFRHPVHGGTT